jgi:dTDP-4-amino-4,6-dideoxygalactose transaminase
MIKHNSPSIKKKYLAKVNERLLSNNLTTGDAIKKVENFFNKKYYKSGSSCLTSSGSSALYLAIMSLSKKKNLRILVPSYCCSAVLNAIYLSGNIPVLSDINLEDFNINLSKKFKAIDIIVALNIFGSDPNIKIIKKIYPNAKIILDACHSIGKKILKKDLSFLADIVIHSFYATKIITSGHGGLIWSKNKKYISLCKNYINFDQRKNYIKRFNFLMSDVQAEILYQQLKCLDKFRVFRKNIFCNYQNSLHNDIKIFSHYNFDNDIIYRSILIFKNNFIRNKFIKHMKKNNIECIIPIENFELLHNYLKINKKHFVNSEKVSSTSASLPMHHNLSKKDIYRICNSIKSFK